MTARILDIPFLYQATVASGRGTVNLAVVETVPVQVDFVPRAPVAVFATTDRGDEAAYLAHGGSLWRFHSDLPDGPHGYAPMLANAHPAFGARTDYKAMLDLWTWARTRDRRLGTCPFGNPLEFPTAGFEAARLVGWNDLASKKVISTDRDFRMAQAIEGTSRNTMLIGHALHVRSSGPMLTRRKGRRNPGERVDVVLEYRDLVGADLVHTFHPLENDAPVIDGSASGTLDVLDEVAYALCDRPDFRSDLLSFLSLECLHDPEPFRADGPGAERNGDAVQWLMERVAANGFEHIATAAAARIACRVLDDSDQATGMRNAP